MMKIVTERKRKDTRPAAELVAQHAEELEAQHDRNSLENYRFCEAPLHG